MPQLGSAPRRRIPRLTILIFSLLLLAPSAAAQTAQFTQGSSGTNTMSLQVPLGALPGRGVSLPINLNYSSKVWRLGFIKSIHYNYAGSNSVAEAIYSEYATAGWTTSLDVPVVEWPKQNDLYWYDGKPYARGTHQPYTFRVAQVFIHMPDGSTHTLRREDQVVADNGSVPMTGTFYAVDGSRMRYDGSGATTGTLYLADGTRYVFTGDTYGTTQYIDRNGNTLSYNTSSRQWTDTLGRTVGMPWPISPQPIAEGYPYAIPGVNGTTITYTLKFKNLADALTPNSPPLKPVGDYYLPNPAQPPGDYNSSNFTQATQGASMFVSGLSDFEEIDYQTNTRVIGRGQVGSTVFDPVVLAEIVLPALNGVVQSYKFSYNNFGELDKVIYPSGAYQRYQYNVVPALGEPLVPYPQVSRGITSRWLCATGSGLAADEVQWLYEFTAPFAISVTAPGPTGAPDGIKTVTYLHNYPNPQNNFGYDSALNGLAYEERVYAPGINGPMIRRSLTDWAVSSATYDRPQPPGISTTGYYTATRNARPKKTVSLVLDTGGVALTSASTSDYDLTYQFSVGIDRISASEYPFTTVDQSTAQSGAISTIPMASSPLRISETTFLTSDANYRDRNILGLVNSSVVKKGTTIVSQASFSYDESEFPSNYSSVTGWINPQTPYRGNVTTVRRWLDYPSPTWLQTHAEYDQCGSVRKAWDARDTLLANPSQVSYADAFADGLPHNPTYAFPTTTTSAVPDPDGTYGQTTGLVSSAAYDFNTGLVTSATDANNRTTTFEYIDPLNRPTKVNRPDGGWTATEYIDGPVDIYVRTQTLQQSTPTQIILESYQYFDKLGRSVRSFATEGATYLTSDTEYDKIGRILRVSNPYRTTSRGETVNPTDKWTTNTYDTLSRVKDVTAPDGSQATTAYGYGLTSPYLGVTVTATDPALKARKSITDAQGRLIQVIENPNGVAPDVPLLTNYTYDVLNNLRKVEQGSQLRYFGYDSLSRVIRTRAVEQTVNPALNWTDPVTTYSGGWTTGVSYDNNGNVTTRIDARNVTTTYDYDGLNRSTRIVYSTSAQTPTVKRFYDGATNGIGRLWKTETTGDRGSRTTTNSYDALGRPTSQSQQFYDGGWSNPFTVSATYDKAGHVLTQTYPSGHTVSYSYDSAGRTNGFTGYLGDNVLRNYSTEIVYSAMGAITKEKFGTATPVFNKLFYNSRGQLAEIRESTSYTGPDDTDFDRGAIINHYSNNYDCWGASCNAPDNNGNLMKQEIHIRDQQGNNTMRWQQYEYDSLNRLSWVREISGAAEIWRQTFVYDRYGNRSIDQGVLETYGTGINKKNFTVNVTNNNRLGVPSGQTGAMDYDAAGNLINDTYTGVGTYQYNAENRLTEASPAPVCYPDGEGGQTCYPGGAGTSEYIYDGNGQRVRRILSGVMGPEETWQVYGMGGELLAEYAANAAPSTIKKEYGYRNGVLLVTGQNYAGNANLEWLVTDQLGTPRMVIDKTGSVAGVSRHDYLPFGEEIFAGTGGRTTSQGYVSDTVRQHFTGYEADAETGLNFAQARYQSSVQGRFTSVDPLGASASVGDPQSFNRYSYVNNNPTNLTDPSGMQAYDASNSYTDVAGSQPQPFNPNRSHFGGPAILFAAGVFHSVGVAANLQRPPGQTHTHPSGSRSARPSTRRFNEFAGDAIRATYGGNAADGQGAIDFSSVRNEFAGGARAAETPLTLGIAIARQRIPGCPAVFKSGNGLSLFNGIVTNGGIVSADAPIFDPLTGKQDRLINNPEIYAVFGGGRIFLNPVGPLSDGRWRGQDFLRGLSEAESYALIFIHETAHGTGDFPPDTESQSYTNSWIIRVTCFPDRPLR